jgi:hypothetical protein
MAQIAAARMRTAIMVPRTLGKDAHAVSVGDIVVKSRNEPHGFTDVSQIPNSFDI